MSLSFLLCSERSGSNFITKLVNGHRNVCGPSTKHIFNPVARNLFRYGDLTRESNWNELLDDIDRMFNVDFSVWRANIDVDILKTMAVVGDVATLLENIFLAEARINKKDHVFIKENHVYEFFPFLETFFPGSRYIYLVRDPRDMALSWKKNRDHQGEVVAAATQWRKDQVQNLKNYSILASQHRAYRVHYEDLIVDTQRECEAICEALKIPFDPAMVEFPTDELTRKNSSQVEAWRNLSGPVLQDNARKYKSGLEQREIEAVESICLYEMRYFGYEPEYVVDESRCLDDRTLEQMAAVEREEIGIRASPGVVANMDAKKRFYRRPGR